MAKSKEKAASENEAVLMDDEKTIKPAAVKKAVIVKFFQDNPAAKSVVIVGDSLFLGTYYGAAKEFATRNNLKLEEIHNPKFAEELGETEETAEN